MTLNATQLPRPLASTNRDAAGGLALHTLMSAMIEALGNQRNLLVNGGFEIWQLGNGPFTNNSAYTADRYQFNLGGTDSYSVSKDTTHVDTGSVACLAATFTLGSGGGSTTLDQKLEDYAQLAGLTLSASVRVRCNAATQVRLAFYDTVSGWRYGSYNALTSGAAYETLTFTATIAAATTAVHWGLAFSATGTVYVDNTMLVVGSTPMDYIPLSPADEWARCRRYLQVIGSGQQSNEPFGMGIAIATNSADFLFALTQPMPVVPILTGSLSSDWSIWQGGALIACTSLALASTANGLNGIRLQAGVAGTPLIAGQAYGLLASNTNARLYLTANP